MNGRFIAAVVALGLACGPLVAPARGAQQSLADAQRDYNAGRYNRAIDATTSAIEKSPNDASLHFLLGQCYYQLGQFSNAAADLEHAVRLDPNQSMYHDWLGKAYGRKAEQSVFFSAMSWARKTHKEFETAVELNPSNFEAQRDLIRYEMNAPGIVGGGDDKAQKHIDELEKLDDLQGLLARGEFFATKRRTAEADAVFAKILESNSDHIGIYLETADYYRDRQNAEKMGKAIAAAEKIDADDRRLKFYKGIFFIIDGKNLTQAESLLKSYLNTVPNNTDLPPHAVAREWLGKLFESQKKFAESADEYRKSLALDPHNKGVEEALRRVERK